MTYETYPLSALAIAAENVRHAARPDDGIPALAQLIADSGLQQPLCGYRKDRTKLLIYDGRRRLLALQHLASEDRLPKDCIDGVACRIGSKAEARAASLGAALGTKDFHPTEAFRQFAALIEEGQTVPDIARRFSLSEREVEQRLRLARLAPPIFDAFAEDAITLEQAMAYALIDDRDRGDGAWFHPAATFIEFWCATEDRVGPEESPQRQSRSGSTAACSRSLILLIDCSWR